MRLSEAQTDGNINTVRRGNSTQFLPKAQRRAALSSSTHGLVAWLLVVSPHEEGRAVICSGKGGWARTPCSRAQLQLPLHCSRSTLNNHNLAGKKEKELTTKTPNKP